MKKLIALLLALSLVFCLAACSSTAKNPGDAEKEAPAADKTSSEEPPATDETPSEEAPEEAPEETPEEAPAETTGISQEKLDTTLYVGCAFETYSNPYLATFDSGCQLFCQYLDSIGQKYEYEVMLYEGNSEEQLNQINAFLAKSNGNAILFIDPCDAAVVGTIAEAVDEAGAYMSTTWTKPDDINVWDYDGWVAHHSPDDVTMGYEVAKLMFEQFDTPGEGKIVAIQGTLGHTTANNRYAGLEKALEEYPNVELVAVESGEWMSPNAMNIMETWLAAHSDIDGVWCANDNMAMGAIQALQAKGLAGKVKVVGINAIPNAITYIKEGTMTASVNCNGWAQGGYSLAMCYKVWSGQVDIGSLSESDRLFGTESIFVDGSNVEQYIETYVNNDPVLDFDDPWTNFRYSDYLS